MLSYFQSVVAKDVFRLCNSTECVHGALVHIVRMMVQWNKLTSLLRS